MILKNLFKAINWALVIFIALLFASAFLGIGWQFNSLLSINGLIVLIFLLWGVFEMWFMDDEGFAKAKNA